MSGRGASLCPQCWAGSAGKVWSRRAASKKGPAVPRSYGRRRSLTHDPRPHPVSIQTYPGPFSGAANAACGAARVGSCQVETGGTGDHGNPRCAARLDPASASRCHSPEGSGTSPEKRRRRKRPKCRRGWGREAAVPGWRWCARAAVWVWRRSSPCRPRVNPSVRQSVLPRVRRSREGDCSAQPLADCGCQAMLEPCPAPSRSQSPRLPAAPQDPSERGGQGGA